ncbi:sugar phosphate isomerase/epimerase family protein [Cohnella pontilimi]|nr:TIM barrel protein [Cohnella pontilimi]
MIIQQSMWSLKQYGDHNREWSLEKKFEQIAAAGFHGIFGSLPSKEERGLWARLMDEYHFSFGLESFPATGEELRQLLEQASDYDVLYVNAQVADAFTTGAAAVTRLEELLEVADRYNMPFFVETHRGRITQDLQRTVEYVRQISDLRLTIDLSHYVLAGEMYEFDTADPYFQELLQRTGSIHGRVSNGQQIQIDMGKNADHPMVGPFTGWWKRGMHEWLAKAGKGDVLPFVCEIGHHYSVTPRFVPGYSWEEISDRWEQTLILKQLVEQVWMDVDNHAKRGNPK